MTLRIRGEGRGFSRDYGVATLLFFARTVPEIGDLTSTEV